MCTVRELSRQFLKDYSVSSGTIDFLIAWRFSPCILLVIFMEEVML